jgi:hypothetical protein
MIVKIEAFLPLAFVVAAAIAVTLLTEGASPKVSPVEIGVVEVPVVNVPAKLRQGNWIGGQGEGSCVHAALISLLRWQGQFKPADYWKAHFSDGEYPDSMKRKLDSSGVRYAWHIGGDERFLEWSCRTRRGAGIRIHGGAHMVALVHLTPKFAGVLDNNDVRSVKWMDREALLSDWKGCNGWAFSPVYSPAAPLPPTSVRRD